MSLMPCTECHGMIDTDEYPDAFCMAQEWGTSIHETDYAICEECRDGLDSLPTVEKLEKLAEWQKSFDKWLHKPIRRHA